ncbi:transmembrane protein PVRIG [Grammomys surdaster]|uniref:transmembrane protein PVRIG n=1 Tax=Grammomys surdaster TaxID=491861 RepID=UPI00109F1D95|nr:transmembrane protein PVRIG [Grammomys surdaster]
MAQMQTLVLLSTLLTLCVSAVNPEVWVQVQMGTTNLSSFSVRCGVLGYNLISLVTVSWKGFVDAGGTKLAVLHPEFGIQQWAPASKAHWETPNSISVTLTLEQAKARSSLANTTFCCEFVTFPHGSRVACRDLRISDPGLSAPILQSDLAGILGTSGFFLFGFIFILCLRRQQRHWCSSTFQSSLTSTQTRMETQLEGWCLEQDTRGPQLDRDLGPHLTLLHPLQPTKTIPGHWGGSTTPIPSPPPPPPSCSAALYEAVDHSDQHRLQCISLPTSDPHQPPCLSPQLPHLASIHSSFISIENGLYALA